MLVPELSMEIPVVSERRKVARRVSKKTSGRFYSKVPQANKGTYNAANLIGNNEEKR